MDKQNPDRSGEQKAADETPEDVAVLYSWANLQGAKYRDFSASRREFRAQMKHRAAEAAREAEEKAREAAEEAALREEEAAALALQDAKDSEEIGRAEAGRARASAESARLAQRAAEDRLEAARHAEAAAAAEAAARRAEREAAEAHAQAERQANQYENQLHNHRSVPGEINDPYTKPTHEVEVAHQVHRPSGSSANRPVAVQVRPGYSSGMRKVPIIDSVPPKKSSAPAPEYAEVEERFTSAPQSPTHQSPAPIERKEQEFPTDPVRSFIPAVPVARRPEPPTAETMAVRLPVPAPPAYEGESLPVRNFIPAPTPQARHQASTPAPLYAPTPLPPVRQHEEVEPVHNYPQSPSPVRQEQAESVRTYAPPSAPRREEPEVSRSYAPEAPRRRDSVIRPVHEDPIRNYAPVPPPPRRQEPLPPAQERDEYSYNRAYDAPQRQISRPQQPVAPPVQRPQENVRPAWLYGDDRQARPAQPTAPTAPAAPAPVPDTLQHSRERVASRWFALKGVFDDQAVPEHAADPQPARQKELRVPTLALFSLAGGVGKTSLVATLGRALSAGGEKVLLTDTTSHGLLPFYFGARELRPGAVRTFSPPPGSTDAPIHMVNYELDQKGNDQQTQDWVMDEIARNSRGVHRMLVDLSSASGWLTRRLARLNPTILVPVAPDMNSVISLQSVEKYFHGLTDADGRPVQPFYILNQFDSSLPLHLDVREVMRQLVGDRLLPFVIRRSQAVSEALAEGMTVMDYAPASPIAEDYMNVASWVRTTTAPATAGYRGARWSER